MTQDNTTHAWGWNGDMCAVWGEAIVLGETRAKKEHGARLFGAASELLALLIESQDSIGGDWRERRDAAIAKVIGTPHD